ncbi:MAG: hypothetical protein JJ911_07820 [Rhizobiaceae bacterium]|nr:hypothetical protein [Rhizobiaceae bacterium]
MPVRRRADKRSAAGQAWTEIFIFGFDMLHRAQWLAGVCVDGKLQPDQDEARRAWHRFGAEFLANYDDNDEPWALAEFGPPRGANAG